VDEDGWGTDAPQVTRSQLEKVAPAYQPTKVNMAELTKQKEPSRFNGSERAQDSASADVVKGAYQPVGKVDIAAIRAQAQKKADDRPTIVKGAYEPVGKVDIAAIRARAQKPGDDGGRQLSPAATGTSATSNTSEERRSLADRSSAFTQSERLTSLPKPKVANKFGGSSFTGTKAPTPGQFGLQSAPATAAPAPVGAASRTFADEGGKTPAQIWAEKKARERGLSGAGAPSSSITSPIQNQTSGGGEWKSGYSGKSWAPVAINSTGRSAGSGSIGQQRTGEEEREQEEAPASPVGGIGAIRDRFKGGAPMGAPSIPRATTGDQSPPPPPINTSNRPSGPTGGVPMPGLPTRPRPDEDEEEKSGPNILPPPRVQRSPTPPTPEARDVSPVRIAMPVARSKEAEIEAPEERNSPPALPGQAISNRIPDEEDLTEEPAGHDPARGAGAAVAEASFGHNAASAANQSTGGKRALIQYDYEKAEDNELELNEGEYVTNIEMVDEDWWMGTNSKGESGLFPSNYVELVEGEEEQEEAAPPLPVPAASRPTPAPAPAPAAAPAGPTATAIYDYEAAEDNELSFDENATITGLVSLQQSLYVSSCIYLT
jgi:drebrin-like protein